MSNTSNLIHCQNGHVFSKKRYGTVCPYCNMDWKRNCDSVETSGSRSKCVNDGNYGNYCMYGL